MGKRKNGADTAAPPPSNEGDAWEAADKSIDEVVGLAKALRVCVASVGSSRRRAKFRASEAVQKMREALREALNEEELAFTRWYEMTDQPDLFSQDDRTAPRTLPGPIARA